MQTPPPADPAAKSLHLTVFWLALPALGEQLLIYCVGLVDTFLAGRLGTEATQAIGLAAYVSWLAALLFSLIAAGMAPLVSRAWGANDREGGNRVFNQAIPLGVLMGVVGWLIIYSAAPLLADLQNLRGDNALIPVRYLRFESCAYVFTSLTLVGTAALRATGDMRTPLVILGLVNVFNVFASTALVYGWGPIPAWGVDGIVGGTVIARVSGALILFAVLARGWSGLRLVPADWRFHGGTVWRILRIGIPAAADGILTWAGHFVFLMVIARLGDGDYAKAVFAAHIVAIQVEALTYLPATAWGMAASTLIGQALGAGQPARAIRVGHVAVLHCAFLGGLSGLMYYLRADDVFALMHSDELVRAIGAPALKFLGFFQVPLVLSIVYAYGLRGAGDTRFPMFFTIAGVFGVRVPLAYLCGMYLHGGIVGAYIGMCSDVTLRAVLAAFRFSRGRWVHIRV